MCGCLLHAPTGDLACNPGMCPDWERTSDPLVWRLVLSPLSHTSQGTILIRVPVRYFVDEDNMTLKFRKQKT